MLSGEREQLIGQLADEKAVVRTMQVQLEEHGTDRDRATIDADAQRAESRVLRRQLHDTKLLADEAAAAADRLREEIRAREGEKQHLLEALADTGRRVHELQSDLDAAHRARAKTASDFQAELERLRREKQTRASGTDADDTARAHRAELEALERSHRHQLEELAAKVKHLSGDLAAAQSRHEVAMRDAGGRALAGEREAAALKYELEAVRESNTALLQQLSEMERRLQAADLEEHGHALALGGGAETARLQEELAGLLDGREAAAAEFLRVSTAQRERLRVMRDDMEAQLAGVRSQLRDSEAQRAGEQREHQLAVDDLENELRVLRKELAGLRLQHDQDLSSLRNRNSQLEAELRSRDGDVSDLKARILESQSLTITSSSTSRGDGSGSEREFALLAQVQMLEAALATSCQERRQAATEFRVQLQHEQDHMVRVLEERERLGGEIAVLEMRLQQKGKEVAGEQAERRSMETNHIGERGRLTRTIDELARRLRQAQDEEERLLAQLLEATNVTAETRVQRDDLAAELSDLLARLDAQRVENAKLLARINEQGSLQLSLVGGDDAGAAARLASMEARLERAQRDRNEVAEMALRKIKEQQRLLAVAAADRESLLDEIERLTKRIVQLEVDVRNTRKDRYSGDLIKELHWLRQALHHSHAHYSLSEREREAMIARTQGLAERLQLAEDAMAANYDAVMQWNLYGSTEHSAASVGAAAIHTDSHQWSCCGHGPGCSNCGAPIDNGHSDDTHFVEYNNWQQQALPMPVTAL